jgi:glycosyltransferase involved in cell wall biosynthesis/Flp pilus assembly protein TadD
MRVSIMFRPQGEAPDRAAEVATALASAGHEVKEQPLTSAGSVRGGTADSPEIIHVVGSDAVQAAARAARRSRAALVCEPLPGDPEPSGRIARVMRGAATGRGTVLARDADHAGALRTKLALPYLPPVASSADGFPSVLLAVYERLPDLNARLPQEGDGIGGRVQRWLGEVSGPLRRGGVRHPAALMAYLRGRRLRARGRFAPAVDALNQAARQDGNPVYELYAIKALRESGEEQEALERLERLAAATDHDPDLLGEVGAELMRLGHRTEAEAVAGRLAADAGTGSDAAEFLAEAARIHAVTGDLESARGLALRAAAQAPDGSNAQRTAALALEQAGEPSQALELARRAGVKEQARRLAALLRELGPGWIPQLESATVNRRETARVLAVLEVSLPQAPSGYAYRSRDLLTALRDAGYEPVAATRLGFPASRGVRDWSPVESVDGVVHHRFNVPGMRQYSGVPLDLRVQENAERLLDLVRHAAPAAIIAGTPDLNGVAALALRKATGIPVVYDVRGFPEMSWAAQTGGSDTELYRRRRDAETACASEADAVITLSETMKQELAGRAVDPDRIFVVPQIVDTERFAPRPRDEQLARSYGLDGKFVVGIVSSLTHYEGVDDLLRAVARARPELPEVAALIVGDGRYRPTLERLVEELGIGDCVVFTGRLAQDRVPEHYALLDLFAIPRLDLEVCRAVTPLKPFEALSMAIPVLASDLPALSEIVSASGGGRVVPVGSEDALAETITTLARDPEARERLGRSGREYVLAGHTPERASAALGIALVSLVSKNGVRDER